MGALPKRRVAPARPRNSLRTELPLLVWLVLVWGALWRDFSPGNLVFGLVLALLVVNLLYLPPVRFSGRFRPVRALVFLVKFVGRVAAGSLEVFWLAIRPGPPPVSAVVAVRLETTDDLMMTAVAQTVSLIPGSVVVEIDRRTATIYFHVIDVTQSHDAEDFRRQVRTIEQELIGVFGYRQPPADARKEPGEKHGPVAGDPAASTKEVR